MANEKDLIRKFSEHYQKQEVDQLVNLFSEDATYHDTFYGAFAGHAKIKEMFRMFFRDGKNYVWDMRKVVAEPGAAMAEFFFSFLTTDQLRFSHTLQGRLDRLPLGLQVEPSGGVIHSRRR